MAVKNRENETFLSQKLFKYIASWMSMDSVRVLLERHDLKYWEVRSGNVETQSVRSWNKGIKELAQSSIQGHSVRVLFGDGWGFAHSTKENYRNLVEEAVKIAKVMDSHTTQPVTLDEDKAVKDTKKTTVKIHPHDISLEEKKDLVLEASKDSHKYVTSTQLVYQESVKDLQYFNSIGSQISQSLVYSYVGASVTAKDKVMENFYLSSGATKGYEHGKESIFLTTNKAISEAVAQLKAIVPRGGRIPVIADPGLTDVFVHEAVGHSAEADHVLQGMTCLEGKENTLLAPKHVTIIDDGSIKGAWGSYFYDDEGIRAQKTEIIKNGTLHSLLHSRETAGVLQSSPTGNARAMDVGHQPMVRMSNTYIEKGDATFEELVEEMKNGYCLIGSRGGQVDPAKGNFQFSCATGFEVKNGELGQRLKGMSIGGHTLETLQHIARISNSYQSGMPGFCGKNGQSVPVIGNCPHIFITEAQVGGK
jgi:TldD protein